MVSKKSRNIQFPKHFMAVRNCINILVPYSLGTSLLTYSYIGELRNGQKFKCENKPFIVFILILRRVLI